MNENARVSTQGEAQAEALAQAQAALDADRKARAERAAQRIQAVLAEERCQIIAIPQLADGRVVAVVQIVAQ
jgi:phage gp36-like protein